MGILDSRTTFQPMDYPWAFQAFKDHEEMHWLPNEATALPHDIDDYKNKLTDDERSLVTQILRFFTQTDIDVANGYTKVYMPKFKKPELTMAMASFAAREAVHVFAYSQVVDTLGFGEGEYTKFMDYAEMRDKHEFLWDEPWVINEYLTSQSGMKFIPEDIVEGGREAGLTDKKIAEIFNLAYGLAKFSAFAEGLQLFSSFAMLLNFKRFGLMKGMGSIVAWSVRDESLHVETMIRVFNEITKDYPWLWTKNFRDLLQALAKQMVELEFKFIDLAYRSDREKKLSTFEYGIGLATKQPVQYEEIQLRGLSKDEIKNFVRLTADQRLEQLGVEKIYHIDKNPIPWFNILVAGDEHANFFEQRGTAYAKGMDTSKMDMTFDDMDFNLEPVNAFTND